MSAKKCEKYIFSTVASKVFVMDDMMVVVVVVCCLGNVQTEKRARNWIKYSMKMYHDDMVCVCVVRTWNRTKSATRNKLKFEQRTKNIKKNSARNIFGGRIYERQRWSAVRSFDIYKYKWKVHIEWKSSFKNELLHNLVSKYFIN